MMVRWFSTLSFFILSLQTVEAQEVISLKDSLFLFSKEEIGEDETRDRSHYHWRGGIDYGEEIVIADQNKFWLFSDNQLIGSFTSYTIKGDSLKYPFRNPKLFLTIGTSYKDLKIERRKDNITERALPEEYRTSIGNGVWIVSLIILLFFAITRSVFEGTKSEYFILRRIFSYRDKEETVLWARHFSLANLSHIILLAGLLSFIISLLYESKNSVSEFISYWALGFLVAFAFINIRIFWIKLFGQTFQLKNSAQFHSINYIRISLVLSLILLSVLIVLKTQGYHFHELLSTFYVVGLLFIVLRIIILTLKLINSPGKKIVLKFSYLCGSELVPSMGIVYLSSQII